jgi:D-beta-D-heptose 7-phosphate kinase/D-beta-D-heptose 1-phosphate adenosyltransferase
VDKVVVITGGFDPIHRGHIEYIKAAKELGNILIVGVNSDEWLVRKKGRSFMPFEDRVSIIGALHNVDYAIPFNDRDGTAKDAIAWARKVFPERTIVFANGGDRTSDNIPEMDFADDNIEFAFGVGGDKTNSSSHLLQEWKAPKTERKWGYYRVLHENGLEVKVKELTVEPRKSLSMQRHNDRLELWFVAQGTATVYTINSSSDEELDGVYTKFQNIHIASNQWHRLANETDKPLKIIEIQYGTQCSEEDIERKDNA